jgi:predicted metal-dependent hydrolase
MAPSPHEIRESTRAKRLRVTVYPDGRAVVTKPVRVSLAKAEAFAEKRRAWIEAAQARFLKKAGGVPPIALPKPRRGSNAYKEAVEEARRIAHARLEHFNTIYSFHYGAVSIRNQKTRWGSCSAQNNLSFNYRLAFLPEALQDYLVVHELCHAEEHNHSPQFWAQVARTVPDYKARGKELRTHYSL